MREIRAMSAVRERSPDRGVLRGLVPHATLGAPHRRGSTPVARSFPALRISELRGHRYTYKLERLIKLSMSTALKDNALHTAKQQSRLNSEYLQVSIPQKQPCEIWSVDECFPVLHVKAVRRALVGGFG